LWYDNRRTTKTNANGVTRWRIMDGEDSLEVKFTTEADEQQVAMLDKLVGKKIWNIEFLEDNEQSMIKILFSDKEDDYLLIHCEGADLYLVEPQPKTMH